MDWIEYLEDDTAIDSEMNQKAEKELAELNKRLYFHQTNETRQFLNKKPMTFEEHEAKFQEVMDRIETDFVFDETTALFIFQTIVIVILSGLIVYAHLK